MARRQGRELVSAVLGEMQERVPEVWDVKSQVVGAMTRDKKIIVELFQRRGGGGGSPFTQPPTTFLKAASTFSVSSLSHRLSRSCRWEKRRRRRKDT